MVILKYIVLIILFASSSYIGVLISQKFKNRVNELKELKTDINEFEAKIKMTYEPIPKIFKEIGDKRKYKY